MVSFYSQVNQTQQRVNEGTAVTAAWAGQLELNSPGKQDLFQLDSLRFTRLIEWLTHGYRLELNSFLV